MTNEIDPRDSAGDEVSENVDGSGYEYVGWPGDGSGEDDLADYNQNEADDYRDEGADDCYEPADTPLGDEYGGE